VLQFDAPDFVRIEQIDDAQEDVGGDRLFAGYPQPDHLGRLTDGGAQPLDTAETVCRLR